MSGDKQIRRDQVDPNYQWDLTVLYENDAAYERAFEAFSITYPELAMYKGTLAESANQLAKVINSLLIAERELSNLYAYAHLKNDQDTTNDTYQTYEARASQLISDYNATVAFFEPELLAIPEETLADFVASNDQLQEAKQFINNLRRNRDHVLSQEAELLLAQGSEVFGNASKTFSLMNNADLVFPEIEDENGKKVQLTHSLYSKYLESTDRRVRRDTFESFYATYQTFDNTLASTLSGEIKKNNYLAKVRNFDSARQRSLFQNNVPESVYDTLLGTVEQRLDLLHNYVGLRKALLGVDQLEMYDMYTPLLGEPPIKFTYEEAKEITLKALAPLGEDYLAIIHQAFDERWIDVYENKGKRSGAYSSGTYDSKPYILMNWQDGLNSLYTLVHELGHSAHSYLTHNNQPYMYGDYSIFLAEIASTTNENLLTSYLLANYSENEIQLYVLNHFLDGLKGTVFRQTQFAEFEHFMYQQDQASQPLTANFLTENYRKLNVKYYGDAVNSDSEIALEWSRIPHFYYNYYVFQYATGFAAATAFAKRIIEGDQGALEAYLGFLKSGNSQYPIDTMKSAGLDMTQSDYINDTLDVFEQRLNQFKELLTSDKAE